MGRERRRQQGEPRPERRALFSVVVYIRNGISRVGVKKMVKKTFLEAVKRAFQKI